MRDSLGYLFIFMAAICWAFIGPVGRFAMNAGVDPLEVAFWRAAVAGFFFLLYAARNRTLQLHSGGDLFVFALFGACSLGGFFASYQYAVQYGGAALASVLLYTAPAWVAVFSRVFFGDRLTLAKAAAIGIALTGVALISFSGPSVEPDPGSPGGIAGTASLLGILFGLLSGLLYSTHYVFAKKYLSSYSTYTMYGYAMLFGAITLFPFVHFTAKGPFEWFVVLFVGLICTFAAYMFYCEGIKRLDLTRAAVLATLEPVVATAAAWWLWNEYFAFGGWIGAALIIAAVLLLVLDPTKEKKGSSA